MQGKHKGAVLNSFKEIRKFVFHQIGRNVVLAKQQDRYG